LSTTKKSVIAILVLAGVATILLSVNILFEENMIAFVNLIKTQLLRVCYAIKSLLVEIVLWIKVIIIRIAVYLYYAIPKSKIYQLIVKLLLFLETITLRRLGYLIVTMARKVVFMRTKKIITTAIGIQLFMNFSRRKKIRELKKKISETVKMIIDKLKSFYSELPLIIKILIAIGVFFLTFWLSIWDTFWAYIPRGFWSAIGRFLNKMGLAKFITFLWSLSPKNIQERISLFMKWGFKRKMVKAYQWRQEKIDSKIIKKGLNLKKKILKKETQGDIIDLDQLTKNYKTEEEINLSELIKKGEAEIVQLN